ncbi:hypothetical protein [Saccharibacter floricola]|uniref:Uncharacterized protein n=1 Tax=Saccharibacter floricola DSM 15669 TaxID=1123227 RepID=A0ABQ0NZL3_9PROT|nr:hypothetical protein [Saccharibacter floricola]GBQ07499.1 hypothetical protein AA15669_1404 [Saccharibacter floricola DSM 15669]
MKLCLGVKDVVYGGKNGQATTTSQVAQILEERYGIFSGFLEANSEWLTQEITTALAGAAASALVNAEPVGPPLERVAEQLAHKLFAAISDGSIETMTHGPGHVPTLAAQMGVNHRSKSGLNGISPAQLKAFRKAQRKLPKDERTRPVGDPRPSFIDTSLLHSSIKGWTKE